MNVTVPKSNKEKRIMDQLTAKKVLKKISESSIWEIYLQIRNGKKTVPFQKIYKGSITDCVSYLNKAVDSSIMKDSSGVLVSDNAIGNVFFKFDNGKLATSPSPYPGLKYMTAKEFQLFR